MMLFMHAFYEESDISQVKCHLSAFGHYAHDLDRTNDLK